MDIDLKFYDNSGIREVDEDGKIFDVEVVTGNCASDSLRQPINDLLRPYGIAVRFFWVDDDVQGPPYAFFCKRTTLDDQTEEELERESNG